MWQGVSLKLIVKDIASMFAYHFVNPALIVEIIFRKERTAKNVGKEGGGGGGDFEIVDIDTLHTCISPWADTFFGYP